MVRLDKRFLALFLSVLIIFSAASFYYYQKTVQDGKSITLVDFRVYYYAGFRLEEGMEIYDPNDGFFIYKYSPIFALAMSTIKFLTPTPAHALVVWYIVLFISFLLSLYMIKEILFRTADSVTLQFLYMIPFFFLFRYFILVNFIGYLWFQWPPWVKYYDLFLYAAGAIYMASLLFALDDNQEKKYLPVMAAAVILNLRFVLENIDRAQVNLIILMLLLFFSYYLIKGKDITAGIYLGIAIIIKLVPAIFLLYLLVKKRMKAFLSAAATFFLLLFIPFFKWGQARNIGLIKGWIGMLKATVPAEYLDHKNQSVLAMVSRFFSSTSDVAVLGLDQIYVAALITFVYLLAAALLIYITAKRGKTANGFHPVYDLSLFFIAMTFLSPIGTKSTFIYTLLPLAVLVGEAFRRGLKDRYLNFGLSIYAILIYLNSPDIVGGFSVALHKYSLMTLCLFALFALTAYAKLTYFNDLTNAKT